jgi:predicted RND superfamily exporter protein
MQPALKIFFNFCIVHNKKILGILGIFIAIIFTGISNFKLDASSDSLVLENDKDVLFYQQLRNNYPSDENLIISYQTTQHILDAPTLSNFSAFIKDLQQLQTITHITSILNVPLFSSPPLGITDLAGEGVSISQKNADLILAQSEFQTSPLYGNNLVSSDGKTTAILVDITPENTNHSISQIRNVIAKHQPNATIFLGGLPMITHDIIEYISSDLLVFSTIVILVMAAILLAIFKSVRFMLLPLGVAIITALTMTGILGLLGWKITVISSNFFSLLLVMTLSIMVHLIVRYRELAHAIAETQERIVATLQQMFTPCLYTTLTTLVAFISLLVSGIRPVIDFGFMMGMGVILAFVLSFILFAVIMNLLGNTKITHTQPASSSKITNLRATKILAQWVERFPRSIVGIASILFAFALYGISFITVENRFIDYFKDNTEIHQGLKHIDKNLGGTIPVEIIFKDIGADYFYDSEIRENIATLHAQLEHKPEIGKVLSIDTLMQILAGANDGQRIGGFFLNIVKSQIPEYAKQHIFTPYINEDTGEIRIIARVKETHKGLNRNNLIHSLENDITQLGFAKDSFTINGLMVLYNNMLQSLFDSQIKTIVVVFIMIWIMFVILFKSVTLATLASATNILPPLLILGIMGIFGIPLDLMTITIAAIAIGIGVDNAIHYVIRFKKEFRQTHNYMQSMFNAHGSIGLAMFYTSITITIGFLVLIFSNFVPSIYFGIFTALAMFLAMLLNLTLLPRLIVWVKPHIPS